MKQRSTESDLLKNWEDGTIRVKDTRLLVDMIVEAHNRGQSPGDIFTSFPSEMYSVVDIAAIVVHYEANKNTIDKYITERQQKAEQIWKMIKSDPKHKARIAELKRYGDDR